MVANTGLGADLQDAALAKTSAITTNAATGTIDASGEIKLMVIDVSNTDPFTLTLTEAVTGATVFSSTNVTADLTLIPRLAVTGSDGVALTFIDDSATNTVYAPVNCLGINYSMVGLSNTANTVSIGVLTDKNP